MTVGYSWFREVERPKWILPKGGWELGETMEERGVRACVNHTRKLAYWEARNQTVRD
jgi:ADP-ribose pyrophosphatase YjhB (NUDIX family)